jgi:hypothetical protein
MSLDEGIALRLIIATTRNAIRATAHEFGRVLRAYKVRIEGIRVEAVCAFLITSEKLFNLCHTWSPRR